MITKTVSTCLLKLNATSLKLCSAKKPIHRLFAKCTCRNNRYFSTSFVYGDSSQVDQHREVKQCQMPQVKVPEGDQDYFFRGLETDFPCLSENQSTGPEPEYDKIVSGYKTFTYPHPFHMRLNQGILPELNIAYETWGELNMDKNNAVLLHTGLSASSHARSHEDNSNPGWWEKFVGPGCAIDTSKYFVICTNNLGGCYGTTGPSSINPLTDKPYATTFPMITAEDMVRAQFTLLDHLGIEKLNASIGSSLGGLASLCTAVAFPERVGRVVCISSSAQAHPSTIALRYLQRKAIMMDPNWNKGYYYDGAFPKMGMKLAREIATISYRSGPEWDERFGIRRIDEDAPHSLCPSFLIENYLEHQGEAFSNKYDPNSLLYISKAMDMFNIADGYDSVMDAVRRVTHPILVLGVKSDNLFPVWQQRALADLLHDAGNTAVTYFELNSIYGHDTFLLDLNGVGAAVKGFLETPMKETGWLTKHKRRTTES